MALHRGDWIIDPGWVGRPAAPRAPEEMARMLHIYLLGHVRVESDGRPIALSLPANALLAWTYVLLHCAAPLPRAPVAFTLWPDLPEADALARLRRQLHVLQQRLPPPPADRPWLLARRHTIQWNPEGDYWLDVEAFEARCLELKEVTPWEGVPDRIARLASGIDLYCGDLLADLYDDWVLEERERLGQTYVRALWHLSALQASTGDMASALATARRFVAYDVLREEAHRLVMGLAYLAGDRGAALQAFEICRQQLGEALHVEPMPETLDLAAAIRASQSPEHIVHFLQPDWPTRPPREAGIRHTIPHHLPSQISSFVGRQRELEEVTRLLATHRLVTLTGPGGCGKTRLALEVARALVADMDLAAKSATASGEDLASEAREAPGEIHVEAAAKFPDGAWWVELATLAEPALVPQVVAAALGVREERGESLGATLERFLQSKDLLLVLDNCEHLARACAALVEWLLGVSSGLRVLATSREVLGVVGEVVWLVPSLSVPPQEALRSMAELLDFEAPKLFVERARLRQPGLTLTERDASVVAQICRRLDGLPLALELAAAKVGVLSLAEIAARLDDCFLLLTSDRRGGLAHHRTLRAAMDWSYDLLTVPERVLFHRSSAFAGGFTLEVTKAVFAGDLVPEHTLLDLLGSLLDKSILVLGPVVAGSTRYQQLAILRQYGSERLAASGEEGEIRRRHATHFRALAEASEPELTGPEQAVWLERLAAEHDNLRAALRWSLEQRQTEVGLLLAGALWQFWAMRSHYREGRAWLAQVLTLPAAAARTAARARALIGAGALANLQGDHVAARAYYEEGLAIWREIGDERGIGVALNNLGLVLYDQGDFQAARSLFEESLLLRRALEDQHGVAYALGNLGLVAHAQGDHIAARALFEQCLTILRDLGDRGHIATALSNLASVAYAQADYAAARTLFADSLRISWELDARQGMAHAFEGFVGLEAAEDQPERVVRLAGAAAALREAIGAPLTPADRDRLDVHLAGARRLLGDDAYVEAWAAGHEMTLDGAVQYALLGVMR